MGWKKKDRQSNDRTFRIYTHLHDDGGIEPIPSILEIQAYPQGCEFQGHLQGEQHREDNVRAQLPRRGRLRRKKKDEKGGVQRAERDATEFQSL